MLPILPGTACHLHGRAAWPSLEAHPRLALSEPRFHAGWESAQRTAAAFLRGESYPFSFGFTEADVVPGTLSEVAEGGEGGSNSELGFCGMSGKSGGRVGGVTGAGVCSGRASSGLGMALDPR